jgi:hypothetical protein
MIPEDEQEAAREAEELLEAEVERIRTWGFEELKKLKHARVQQVIAESGRTFQVEMVSMWESRLRGVLRIMVHLIPWWDSGGVTVATPKELVRDFSVRRSS